MKALSLCCVFADVVVLPLWFGSDKDPAEGIEEHCVAKSETILGALCPQPDLTPGGQAQHGLDGRGVPVVLPVGLGHHLLPHTAVLDQLHPDSVLPGLAPLPLQRGHEEVRPAPGRRKHARAGVVAAALVVEDGWEHQGLPASWLGFGQAISMETHSGLCNTHRQAMGSRPLAWKLTLASATHTDRQWGAGRNAALPLGFNSTGLLYSHYLSDRNQMINSVFIF